MGNGAIAKSARQAIAAISAKSHRARKNLATATAAATATRLLLAQRARANVPTASAARIAKSHRALV